MLAVFDTPAAGAPCDPLAFRIEGWIHGGDAHGKISSVEIRLGDHLIGFTHALSVRPDVNAALNLAATTRTGFVIDAHHATADFDAPLTLCLHALFTDGTRTPAIAQRTLHTITRDYRRNHFGVLLDSSTVAIQRRGNIFATGPGSPSPTPPSTPPSASRSSNTSRNRAPSSPKSSASPPDS